MADYDRKTHLKRIHEQRKLNTLNKVEEAIQRLINANKRINFSIVAIEARVSTATLYRNQNIRKRIESLRHQPEQISSSAQEDSKNKDAIIDSPKRKIN